MALSDSGDQGIGDRNTSVIAPGDAAQRSKHGPRSIPVDRFDTKPAERREGLLERSELCSISRAAQELEHDLVAEDDRIGDDGIAKPPTD